MKATPGSILPKICDWMLNKNYESHTRSQTIGNRFQFPSFRHRVKAITRESRTLPIIIIEIKKEKLRKSSGSLIGISFRTLTCP